MDLAGLVHGLEKPRSTAERGVVTMQSLGNSVYPELCQRVKPEMKAGGDKRQQTLNASRYLILL